MSTIDYLGYENDDCDTNEVASDCQAPKYDQGKPRLSLVPASLDYAVAQVREYGVNKYGKRESWRGVSVERYFEALLRHVQDIRAYGVESIDSESGLPHIYHVACNAAFIIDLSPELSPDAQAATSPPCGK